MTLTGKLILKLFMVLILNILSNSLATLKTMFLSKNMIKPVYFIVFFDAIIFASIFKTISNEQSFLFIIAFASGKVGGVWLGNKVESKIALGILEVTIYAKPERAKIIADNLRELGYSVTTHKGFGYLGKERYAINITIARKELSLLKEILKKYNLEDPTMQIKEIKSVNGKIKINIQKPIKNYKKPLFIAK